MEVDKFGLDERDRKLLLTIIEKFDGGPVGIGTISASIHEEKDSIEEIIEPYLIQIGSSFALAAGAWPLASPTNTTVLTPPVPSSPACSILSEEFATVCPLAS